MVCGDFKYLAKRTAQDKVLRNKAFNIAKNPKYDGYQRGLASQVHRFLIKKPLAVVLIIKLNKINNLQINFTNQLLKKFKTEEFIYHLKTIFGGVDLDDTKLISKFNKGFSFYYVLLIILANMVRLFL